MPNRLLLRAAELEGLERLITNLPLTKRVANRFVAGHSLEDGLRATAELGSAGIGGILDYLGENVRTDRQADAAAKAYLESLEAIKTRGLDAHVSVKLTQLGLDQSMDACVERMEKILAKAAEVGTTVAIDMEGHAYTDITIETYRRLRSGYANVVLCLQAYLRRTPADIISLLQLEPAIRLCKGAYNEPRSIAYNAASTISCYKAMLETLLETSPYTAAATHDPALIDFAKGLASGKGYDPSRYEFQMLYGVRRDLQADLVRQGHRVRVYIPFGSQWYPYLMRRLAERPANLRFFLEAIVRG